MRLGLQLGRIDSFLLKLIAPSIYTVKYVWRHPAMGKNHINTIE